MHFFSRSNSHLGFVYVSAANELKEKLIYS